MDRIDIALDFILEAEGGWADVKGDRGGATNWGITIGLLKGLGRDYDLDHDGDVDVADLRLLTKEQAREIYVSKFLWVMDGIQDCRVAVYLADTAVNSGPHTAVHILQDALNLCGFKLKCDGTMGPLTKNAANAAGDALFPSFQVARAVFYRSLVKADPSQQKFLRGWLNRAQRVPKCASPTSSTK